ncbi:MAG: hypothetical protein ABSE27_00905 [Acidobacteriaceae bacterium]|jgi:hypothetical protein
MYWVYSLLVVTRRGGKSGIWCERCRAKQAAVWSSVTGIVGWWGVPWGPIYTVQALYHNALGGKQDRAQNAALLRLVAYQLYQKGEIKQSLETIVSSLKLEQDKATEDFANSLRAMCPQSPATPRDTFRLLTALPSIAICIAIIFGIYVTLNRPTGYETRYEPPINTAPPPITNKASASSRDNVNELIGSLADAVHQNATVSGTHQEGTTTITDYVLDREKYDYKDFERIAVQIEPYLTDAAANRDGFASSAFFNAKIMELSIEIENGIDTGENVQPAIFEFDSLSEDPPLIPWLDSSQYLKPYQILKAKLRVVSRYYESNPSQKPTDEELGSLKRTIDTTHQAFEQAQATGDSQSEKTLAAEHDRYVDQFNLLVKRHNQIIAFQRGLDLAFNRCLDPKVLMSRFDQVNLTSGSDDFPDAPQNK